MPALKLEWTPLSRSQFEKLRQRAIATGRHADFAALHNEIITTLSDLDRASEKGEPLYNTRKAGGEVRHWVKRFIAVSYVLFREERIGWIVKYLPVPESWPE